MSVNSNIDWIRSPPKPNNYADRTKFDDYIKDIHHLQKSQCYDEFTKSENEENDEEKSNTIQHNQMKHIQNIKISASQHSLPDLNKTQIKRCLSSPSLSAYDTLQSKQYKMKELPDLMELYKTVPSFRLNIENLSRQTKVPINNNDSYILCHHKSSCIRNSIILGFFRTFAASFVLKTALLLFQNALFGKLLLKSQYKIYGVNIKKLKCICTNKDSLLFAQVMGLMSFTYKAILCLLRRYFKKDDIKYHSIAGFISGFWIYIDNPRRQQTYAMNGLIRSIYDAIKLCVFYGKLPYIKGFNVICFGVTQIILLNAAFWKPECVHPTLYKFFLKMGNMTNDKIQVLRDGILTKQFVECCPSLHKDKSCLVYNIKDFMVSIKRASIVYLAVHFLPMLLFEPKKIFLNPKKYFKQSCINTMISCLFVASYNFMVKGNVCLFRNTLKRDYWWTGIFCAIFASLTLFIENIKRRPEVTLHCMTRSLEIIMRLFTKNKWPKLYTFLRSKYLRIVSFQISVALWLTIRQIPKGIEKSNNLNMTVIRMIFGSHN